MATRKRRIYGVTYAKVSLVCLVDHYSIAEVWLEGVNLQILCHTPS